MARGIRFCRTFLHVARVKKPTAMQESQIKKPTAMRESQNPTRFSHGRRFFDSRNVQKSVTQIIYLGPLPTAAIYFLPLFLGTMHTLSKRKIFYTGISNLLIFVALDAQHQFLMSASFCITTERENICKHFAHNIAHLSTELIRM